MAARLLRGAVLWLSCGITLLASAQENPFISRWALTPGSGGAGWLEIRQEPGYFTGSLLWIGGSPEPLTCVFFDGETLYALRVRNDEIRDASGNVVRTQPHPILVTATRAGDELSGVFAEPNADGTALYKIGFTGRRLPPLPPRPDQAHVRFADAIPLFNGKDLDGWVVSGGAHWGQLSASSPEEGKAEGWIPVDSDVTNGWSVKDGVLANNPLQTPGAPYIRYGNLQTRRDFEDFNLTLEVNVPADGNSGIYLRGIYEIQIRDSFGQALDSHNMGALYGRITPAVAAERPAGEWQALDITLIDHHVTVKLNGQTIINNQPILGCTGGALWSDESRPGPIYFQGDHTAVQFRNIVLRPVLR